ncbi:MAG: hypothetical protein ABR964_01980 [Tepidisphaeraceae bacterium]|jgi:type II secretory pathway component GspD/PulD (secretin)
MRRLVFASLAVLFIAVAAMGAVSAARRALETALPEVKFNNTPLADALDFLRDASGANILVDWKALEAAKVARDAPVTLTLHSVKMEKVLSLILAQAAGGEVLSFYVEDNIIQITSRAAADQKLITVVYPVMDLVALDENFDPTISGGLSFSGGGTGGGGGGGSGTLSSSTAGAGGAGNIGNDQRIQKLIKLIETEVRPEIWKDNGGPATIDYFNGNLIVTAPRSVQEAIGGFVE